MPSSTPPQPVNRDGQSGFRFLSIGECMVEMVPADQPGHFRMGFAGDTFNTAWYLRAVRPDLVPAYFSQVGSDDVSDQMLAMMAEAGIDITHIGRSVDRTVGLYLISLKEGERSFSYWRDRSAARQLAQFPDRLLAATDVADLLYFSGITIAILDCDDRAALLEGLATARAAGKTIAFDTNLRPRLWASETSMCEAIMEAASVSDIVLPSYEDEANHFGDACIEDTAARYRDVGATTVVVKNGAEAVHYLCDGVSGQVAPAAAARIVDTTSAGDSFNAGFFAGFDGQFSMEERIQFATRVSGQVIAQKGALVPLDLVAMAG